MAQVKRSPRPHVAMRIAQIEQEVLDEYGLKVQVHYTIALTDESIAQKRMLRIMREEICRYYSLPDDMLKSPSRKQEYVRAREMFCRFAKDKYPDIKLRILGIEMGGRDHSTVINNLKKFDSHYEAESDYRKEYNELQEILDMNKTLKQPDLTRSELVAQKETLEERRKAIIERMAAHDIPIDTDSFRTLVKEKQDLTIEIEGMKKKIHAMDWKRNHPDGYPGPTMNKGISFEL